MCALKHWLPVVGDVPVARFLVLFRIKHLSVWHKVSGQEEERCFFFKQNIRAAATFCLSALQLTFMFVQSRTRAAPC